MPLFYLKACKACRGDLAITDEGLKCLQCARYATYRGLVPNLPPERTNVRRRDPKYAA